MHSLIDAFDENLSGSVSIVEVNRFTDMKPPDWSLQKWIVYWTLGLDLVIVKYAQRITDVFNEIHQAAIRVLPKNRNVVECYISNLWLFIPVLAGVKWARKKYNKYVEDELEDQFRDFLGAEEEKLSKNLNRIQYKIDTADTVTVVMGGGRLEEYILPLIYLVLKSHLTRIEAASTEALAVNEFYFWTDAMFAIQQAIHDRLDQLRASQIGVNTLRHTLKTFARGMFRYIENDNFNGYQKFFYNTTSLGAESQLPDWNVVEYPTKEAKDEHKPNNDPEESENLPEIWSDDFPDSFAQMLEEDGISALRDAVRDMNDSDKHYYGMDLENYANFRLPVLRKSCNSCHEDIKIPSLYTCLDCTNDYDSYDLCRKCGRLGSNPKDHHEETEADVDSDQEESDAASVSSDVSSVPHTNTYAHTIDHHLLVRNSAAFIFYEKKLLLKAKKAITWFHKYSERLTNERALALLAADDPETKENETKQQQPLNGSASTEESNGLLTCVKCSQVINPKSPFFMCIGCEESEHGTIICEDCQVQDTFAWLQDKSLVGVSGHHWLHPLVKLPVKDAQINDVVLSEEKQNASVSQAVGAVRKVEGRIVHLERRMKRLEELLMALLR